MSAILDLPEARARVMRWSVKEYERFTEMGAFRKSVELIRGIVVEKISKSPLHVTLSQKLLDLFKALVPSGFCVRHEAPLKARDSVPEPDLAVVKGTVADYSEIHPSTATLVVEVAVSNVVLDRENASLYAEAGVDEYWFVLPNQRQVEVYREPRDGAYAVKFNCEAPAVLECASMPQIRVNLEEMFKVA